MVRGALRLATGYLRGTSPIEPLEFEEVVYPYRERFGRGRSSTLCFVQAGKGRGPLVLFLHPGSADLTAFAPQMAALSRRRRVAAVDLPGHGKSDRPSHGMSPDDMAEEIWDALGRTVRGRKLAIVGNSIGGGVALAMALARPDRVERLVLVAAAGTKRASALERTLFRLITVPVSRSPTTRHLRLIVEGLMFHRPCEASRAWIEKAARLGRSAGYLAWRASQETIMRRLLLWDARSRLGRISCPTLIVWGRQDRLVPLSEAHVFHHSIPDSQLVLIDRCGHVPQLEQPERVTRALESFLT